MNYDKTKKEFLIHQIKSFDDKYFNQDQKNIMIQILKNAPDKEAKNYFEFLKMKRKTGFAFDYSPEPALGRIITLRENTKKRINCDDNVSDDENKLIIGDNYNALKSLLVTHKNKIDVIYIDPPYNTESAKEDGNQSSKEGTSSKFIYKDKFGRGGWLNMIKVRLELAKKLLTDEGVIFVSIDDKEQAYLKVLMDDIFGEENFISLISYVSNKKGRQTKANVAITTEYILFYKKNILILNNLETDYVQKIMPDIYKKKEYEVFTDERGAYVIKNELKQTNITKFGVHARPNLRYPIYINKTNTKEITSNKPVYKDIKKYYEIYPIPSSSGWRWDRIKVNKDYKQLWFNVKNKRIYTKNYNFKITKFKNIILGSSLTTKGGGDELKKLNLNNFEYPKNNYLLMLLMRLIFNKNALVLDFFAGSGTTGQAVMELNRKDGGNRKFILCTNNENNIAIDVTYERMYRIIKGKGSNGETNFKWLNKNEPYYDTKLRVIDIDDSVNISLTDQNKTNLSDKIIFDVKKGLQLLDDSYNAYNLDLYYDLSALNPIDNEYGLKEKNKD